MKPLLISLLIVSAAACATPMHGNWKNPIMSPVNHVSCRPVATGEFGNSGCIA